MSQTRSESNSTSPSISCNLAKNAVASLSASGVDGGKEKRCLNNVGTLAIRTSSASSGRQLKPDMVEVLHSLATSTAETGRTLKEMMKSQQELLRIIQEEREELTRAHAQNSKARVTPPPQTF
jgi:hypothetical protein